MPRKRAWSEYAGAATWSNELGAGNSGADSDYQPPSYRALPRRSRSPSPSLPVPGAWVTELTFAPAMHNDNSTTDTRPVRAFSTLAVFSDAFKHVSDTFKGLFHLTPYTSQQTPLAQRIRPEPVYPHNGASKRILLDEGLSPPDTPLVLARQVPGAYPSLSPRSASEGPTENVGQQSATAQATGQSAAAAEPTTPCRSPSPFALDTGSSPFFDGTQTQSTPGRGNTTYINNAPTSSRNNVGLRSRLLSHCKRNSANDVVYTNNVSLTSNNTPPATNNFLTNTNITSPLAHKKKGPLRTSKARRALTEASPSRLNASPISKEKQRLAYINSKINGVKDGRIAGKDYKIRRFNNLLGSIKDEKQKAVFKEKLHTAIKSNNNMQLDWMLGVLEKKAIEEQTEWSSFFERPEAKPNTDIRDDAENVELPTDAQNIQALKDTQHIDVHKDAQNIRIHDDTEMGEAPAASDDAWGGSPQKPLRPQKSVSFKPQVRERPFFEDNIVFDTFESFLTDLNEPETPVKVPEPQELAVSREVVEEIRLQPSQIKAIQEIAQDQEASQETPAIIVEDVPLLPPVRPKDLKYIIEASEKTNGGLIQKDLVDGKVSTHDMKTVLPQDFHGPQLGWLNDNIINGYLEKLTDHEKNKAGYKQVRNGPAPPVHALASQWYASARRDIKSVARWATRKNCGGKNLLDMKVMLLPVCEGSHWRLVAIKPQERTIEYLDSLGWDGSTIITTAVAWLKEVLGDLWVENEWTIAAHQRSGRQLNGSDCGVFTCLNALALLKGVDPGTADVEMGMREGRQHIAVSLLSGKLHGGC